MLSLPLAARAQTADSTPRYYVGLAAYSSDFQPLGGTYYGGTTVPVQLTLGYQVLPRLAVQLGVAYSGNSYRYTNDGPYPMYTTAGRPATFYTYSGNTSWRSASVSLLARYTLTRKPEHRVQFDVLGGLTLDHDRTHYDNSRTDTDSLQNVIGTVGYNERYSRTNFLLTGGLSTRYRFSQRLEAVLDVTLSRSFLQGQYAGFPGSTALGLRYRFGQR
ncbi:hypothetical protein GCM10027422_38060 [Hymenobacter arcticus]